MAACHIKFNANVSFRGTPHGQLFFIPRRRHAFHTPRQHFFHTPFGHMFSYPVYIFFSYPICCTVISCSARARLSNHVAQRLLLSPIAAIHDRDTTNLARGCDVSFSRKLRKSACRRRRSSQQQNKESKEGGHEKEKTLIPFQILGTILGSVGGWVHTLSKKVAGN